MRYVYLHGFASGPQSRKARAFRDALAAQNQHLEIPDLAQGDFEHLTVSGQLHVIENVIQGDPCRLAGSSMGGYLACLYAASHPEVDRLVLLAPAFRFAQRREQMLGPEAIAQWKATGWLEVFHYGDQTMRRVHYGLFEDASAQPPCPDFGQPALIFHGVHDDVVPVELSRAFAASHPNAELREMDSDHELLNVLEAITSAGVSWLTGR